MRAHNFHRNKFKKYGNPSDWEKYKDLKKRVVQQMRLAKISHSNGVCEETKHNPREVWKQLNGLTGRKSWKQITTLKCGYKTITNKKELASCFNHNFASVSQSLPPATHQGPNKMSSKFHFVAIQESEVFKLLSTLDVQKATGHDIISARLLKSVAPA